MGAATISVSRSSDRRRSTRVLLAALALDNLGSGLFLPLTLVYLHRVSGLSPAAAGGVLALGSVAGLLAPALTARYADRIGPRTMVVVSQALQAGALALYLVAGGPGPALAAAALNAAGIQTFYSSLFALISEVSPEGPKDTPFARVSMVRAAAFGSGTLGGGILLELVGQTGLRIVAAGDAASFVAAALLLAAGVRPARHGAQARTRAAPGHGVLRDRPYLGLIGAAALIAVSFDFLLIGLPVYALEELHTASWVPGACLALITVSTSTLGTTVVRRTAGRDRTVLVTFGALLLLAWAASAASAARLPHAWVAPWLVATTVLAAAGNQLCGRVNALAEACAPRDHRGRYLAAFQYAFTVAGLLAPLVAAGFAVARWLPWALVAASATLGAAVLRAVAGRLPAAARAQ